MPEQLDYLFNSVFARTMSTCYTFDTPLGPFHILAIDREWWTVFDGESLGRYGTPECAAGALAGGDVPLLSDGTNAAELAIARDLSMWQPSFVR